MNGVLRTELRTRACRCNARRRRRTCIRDRKIAEPCERWMTCLMYRDGSVVEENIADVTEKETKVSVFPITPVPECPKDEKAPPPAWPKIDDEETTAIVSAFDNEDPVCTTAAIDGRFDLAFLKPLNHAATIR